MDDELDPAFLDLDLPSPHASTSSLGAGFGSTLDHDDLDDLDSLDRHTHAHGLGLDLELDLDTDYGGAGLPASLDDLPDGHSPPSTPPRRRGGSKLAVAGAAGAADGGGGLSLADELASAARPQRQRDLMRELGLGSDSGEEDEDDERTTGGSSRGSGSSSSEEGDMRHGEDALGAGFGRAGGVVVADPFGGSPRRSASSLARFPRPRPSSSSLTSYTPGGSTPDDGDAEVDEAAQQDEVDAALREAAASLDESMQTTSAFLAHLRQHVTTEVDPHAAALAAPCPSPVGIEPPRSSATSSPAPARDYTDRQPVVESHASTLVRRLYELAKQRESHLRELGEVERVLGRTEPGWRAALADLEPLEWPDDEDEGGDGGDTNGDEPPAPTEPVPSGDVEGLSSFGPLALDPARPAPPPRSRPPPASSLALTRAHADLAALRTLTTSLLAALSSISDLTQVQSALASDSGRKLRALKAQAGSLRDELGAVERSEAFVEAFEGRSEGRRTLGDGRAAESARREVEGVRETLEEGWRKAQSMLAVRA
ncbi:hypothetical protein JCM3775_005883 [Rhodotorula graminis]|uniref:Uncharacterized protein n=1 Tax=Rhodotorula graminis (strain WP1) TaxID=578459 RepID=A0A194S1K2_RHOGW|nr:uncharacterized protein RHOBADRAFT_44910 [Rhodotorula graminis WP1]KPV74420.1 hypothetical protein RHOBADRAFT_44910 [Rhodotorula graminis WP1]